MPKALRTEAAERDFENIAFQIAIKDRRPQTARKILRELANQCDKLAKLATMATLGTAAPEIAEGVRLFPYKRWVIIFKYVGDNVIIMRIADGSQDYLAWKL